MKGNKPRGKWSDATPGSRLSTTFLSLYAVIAIGPLLLVVLNSLRTTTAIYNAPIGPPTLRGLANYREAWSQASFSTYIINSVLVTLAALLLGIGAAVMASYPLGRIAFRGKGAFASLFLVGLLLPAQLGIVPMFKLLKRAGLIDSRLGLVLIYATQTLPLAILILTAFFRQLPVEIEEAARLDGANEFTVFSKIVLPLVRPAIATVVVVQAAPIWNDFFYPLVLMRTQSHYTLPVGLTKFFGQYESNFGALFAGLVIVSLPLALVFIFATRQVIAGLTAGSGK